MSKTFLITGTILAGLGVVLGAFGAHGLRKLVPAETVASYQTGVQYQMYHAFALLILGLLADRLVPAGQLQYSGIFFLLGIILFSGSIYIIAAAKASEKVLPKAFFLTTPLGGLLFIVGWLLLLVALIKAKQ
ncbi:DUF423 domain-containing protein [Paraflavisolibacter sp. H34]|uniref:DUF423 domain-containing protein n=1 Tax=Huijunlia imazamoxiresistens TaxID=3127457 RepID=UPI0030165B86